MSERDEIRALLSRDLDRLQELQKPLHDGLYKLYLARNLAPDQLEVLTQIAREMILILEDRARISN